MSWADDRLRESILQYISEHPGTTSREVSEAMSCPMKVATTVISALRADNRIEIQSVNRSRICTWRAT